MSLRLFLPPHPRGPSLCASRSPPKTTRSPQTTVCLPDTLVVFAILFPWSLAHLGLCNDPASLPLAPWSARRCSRPLVSSACIGASSKAKVTTRSLSAILPRSQSHRHTCLPRCFRMPLPDTHTLLPFPPFTTHTHTHTYRRRTFDEHHGHADRQEGWHPGANEVSGIRWKRGRGSLPPTTWWLQGSSTWLWEGGGGEDVDEDEVVAQGQEMVSKGVVGRPSPCTRSHPP